MKNLQNNSLKFAALLYIITCNGASANAQIKSLEDALQPWKLIHTNRPSNSWGEDGMPYEEKNDDRSNQEYYDAVTNDSAFALTFANRQKVWRYATRGDYYLTNLKTGEKKRLGKGLPEASLMFAKFSPNGKFVAYVSKNNIYCETCNGNEVPKQLTFDGNDTIVNGTFDWVYEEEFDCRDGFRWSHDSNSIAFWQSNTAGTGWFDIINNVDNVYPTVAHFPYPKAGTQNSAVKIGVINIERCINPNGKSFPSDIKSNNYTPFGKNQEGFWINIPGDQRENYLPRMEFIPGTNNLLVQQMNRAQSDNKYWKCEIKEDANNLPYTDFHLLTEDKGEAWVETNDNIHWLQGNKYFTLMSERDGWRHLYRVSADGKKWTCITNAELDVIEEVAFDEKRGYVYFMATPPDQATERYLYRAKIFGNGKCERIGSEEAGQHFYDISPTCDYAIEQFSTANMPPKYNMWKCDKSGKWTLDKTLESNEKAKKDLDAIKFMPKEFVKVKSGNLMLDAWIIKPINFDPSKKYPVIDYVYGEPASATVQNRWETSLFWQYLAQQGYVVVSIENRGANSPRGREWRKCIYGEVGVAASEDQARGIQDLCRQFPWMDAERIGITGWSGGGSQTLNCMFRYPDVFKTGIAVAFVSDQKLYDTIYQERYMNTPQNNPEGYKKGSPINFVEGLKGNLLLIHGTGDDNVHYQNCEMLVNELIKHNKTFYQVSYPMRTHSISEGAGTSLHLRKTMLDFWKKYLPTND